MLDVALILITVAIVCKVARRDLTKGFCLSAALLVALPTTLAIATVFTVQRVILAVLVLVWLQAPRKLTTESDRTPFLWVLLLILFVHGISLILSITPESSLKDWLSFAIEIVLFYRITGSTLTSQEAGLDALQALVFGLAGVALIALTERYLDINLPVMIVSHFRYLADGIQSTYPHRILLGYAMAMGMPIALALLDLAESKRQKLLMWLIVFLTTAACFLADSRGGWIGMAIAGMVSLALGTAQTRKRCIWILLLAGTIIVVRPGIKETIANRLTDTFEEDSYKGKSYSYRWTLWHVAFGEISKSPERFLFGYGGLSTESMDLSDYFGHEEGGTAAKIGFTSWDNQYAANLIEFGVLGLAIELFLYLLILARLLRSWRDAEGIVKGVLGGLIAACVVYLFANSNVYIFSAQLKFLFWTTVAIGCAALRPQVAEATALAQQSHPEPIAL